jgi:hypothetical protein
MIMEAARATAEKKATTGARKSTVTRHQSFKAGKHDRDAAAAPVAMLAVPDGFES